MQTREKETRTCPDEEMALEPQSLSQNSSSAPVDMTPSLPPHMKAIRSQTAGETVKQMARSPLFMTSLEDAEADGMSDLYMSHGGEGTGSSKHAGQTMKM